MPDGFLGVGETVMPVARLRRAEKGRRARAYKTQTVQHSLRSVLQLSGPRTDRDWALESGNQLLSGQLTAALTCVAELRRSV